MPRASQSTKTTGEKKVAAKRSKASAKISAAKGSTAKGSTGSTAAKKSAVKTKASATSSVKAAKPKAASKASAAKARTGAAKTTTTTKTATVKRTLKLSEEARMLQEAVAAMQDKKAEQVKSLDLHKVIGANFDYFLIGEAQSGTQVRAIADGVIDQIYDKFGLDPLHKEGYANAEWILLDYGALMVHVFQREARRHYRLEELWGDAQVTTYDEE